MNQTKLKYLIGLILSMATFSLNWANNKPSSSPAAKMKMVMEKLQQEQKYNSWNSQNKILKQANKQRVSMQQRLDMFLGRNPNVGQFFEVFKQSVKQEIDLHKNLSSTTWQILPELKQKANEGKASKEDWILLAKMYGYLNNLEAKVDAYESALKISALKRDEEQDLAQTLKSMNRIVESLDSWSRLVNLPDSTNEQKNEYKFELANANFYIQRFDSALKLLTDLAKNPQWKSKTQRLYKSIVDTKKNWAQELEYQKQDKNLPKVEMQTNKGRIVIELFEDDAPNGVANFISLVEKKYYDGQKFHRVIPNFMAQGGDINSKNDNPADDGQGGPGYTIKTDLNKRKHFRGSFSYANAGLNTDGSQFFLCVIPTTWLDGRHAVFGRIIEGQAVADSLTKNDELKKVNILFKRNHSYEVKKNS